MKPAIIVDNVSKSFKIYRERNQTLKSAVMRRRRAEAEDFYALNDVSFEVPEGSTFALIGDNGSGKSTLLKCMAKILVPNEGQIITNGRMAAMLEVGSGFHPELSGRENVYLNGSILGMSKSDIDARFDEILAFSGVEEFIDQPVKNYSSGMYVRLGFSVAIHTEPDILLVDEILAVGDAAFQDKCAKKFAELRREGRTVVVVSRSVPQLRAMADRAAWLDHGNLHRIGEARTILEEYSDSTKSDVRVDASGLVRWGSGEVLVEAVELLRDDGTLWDWLIPTGSKVIMRLHYNAKERVEKPVFGYSVEANDGTYLWGNNTRDLRFPVDYLEGRGAVDLVIDHLPLAPGIFQVHGSVVSTTTEHVYDYVRQIAQFGVAIGTPQESGGYITMGGVWNWPEGGGVHGAGIEQVVADKGEE